MAQKNILIVSGEPSGEMHAASLTQKILEIDPAVKISGVGGQLLKEAGAEVFYDIKDISVIGLFDVLKKLPHFLNLQKLILKKIAEDKPQAIILVDFSGFNLRLAKKIKKSIPVIYYVSPQVWASRQGRIKTIRKYIDKIIVLFKFEKEFYLKYGINAEFVGHPLLDLVRPTLERKEFLKNLGLAEEKTTLALLPGSRKAEIENILPIMLKAAALINKEIKDVQFLIAKSPQVEQEIYQRKISGWELNLKIAEAKTYDCLNASSFCLVASGTATLETAIMQKPFFIIYKMGLLNYLLYRPQVKVPYIGMVNIVAGKKIIPEFVQFQARPKRIAEAGLKLLKNPAQMQEMINNLAQIKSALGSSGACLRAARIICQFTLSPPAGYSGKS
ncbi:MAG: lipid-A-disaccharide synthase [Candidatus Omnitrophica bacterium]|nr:lipid-A-disaccharide synthase [Candidatus Omnitrophota bacterium]